MGDGALLAKTVRIDVINAFRTADVKAGGQGAPLVPVYHRAIAATLGKPSPSSILAASPTSPMSARKNDLLAFDTGPGKRAARRLDARKNRQDPR